MPGEKPPVVMTEAQLESLLQRAVAKSPPASNILGEDELENLAERVVAKTLTSLGMDAANPLEAQKDFAFIRSLRTSADSLKSTGVITAVGIVVTAVISLIWLGVKVSLGASK